MENKICCGKKCNTCQKKEKHFDNCDSCKKEFCYECLGRISNHLFCDTCYRKELGLKDTDKIVKTVEELNVYKKDETGKKVKTEEKMTIYSWEVKKKK